MKLKMLIHFINRYVDKFPHSNISPCSLLMDQYNGSEWKSHVHFTESKYIKKCLYNDKKRNYELILICWHEKSYSSIHKHPRKGCVLKVLNGVLTESRYKNKTKISTDIMTKNSNASYIHDKDGTHQIIPIGKSISLHLYSPSNFYNCSD